MMSDDDDMDFTVANRSGRNLASLFQTGESGAPAPPVASTPYVAPKQPKKESAPKVMIASVVQAFSLGTDQKWTPRGKMGVALLSTDNTIFQLVLYVTKNQTVTSLRIATSSVFASQANNYLTFQDDAALSWSIMFESKQAMVDFTLRILVAKAFLSAFKFEYLTQDIREGEGSALADHDGAEVTMNAFKVADDGTLSALPDTNDNKPIRVKIGKQQHGRTFDEILKGMKKNGHRIAMIATNLYSIEVVRVKRDKEVRSSSFVAPADEQVPAPPPPAPVERKATATEDAETPERNRMLQRINKMGGVSMLPQSNNPSAFVPAAAPHLNVMSDDDSIINEYLTNQTVIRSTISTPAPPVQFVPPAYHHSHPHASYPVAQPMMQPTNMYSALPEYHNRPGSSMLSAGYPPTPSWQQNQFIPPNASVPPTDLFYQQQQPFLNEFRQLLTRLTEKVDTVNDKLDEKTNKNHPNMETSILLTNIQRIVKENETMKKDLFDRSAKIEDLNLKISELLDRNQKLIEQTHQTAEQRNVVVNNVSEQTAQKILELEKQKVELTNNLSGSTSKIAELQLQVNQLTQELNENQSRVTSLTHKCEQYREQAEKAETQRAEIQLKLDSIQEQFKNEKLSKKQLQTNLNALEEELNEVKETLSTLQKTNNERRLKQENERRRWENEMEEQKQSYEQELEELRNKLRKQRTADSAVNNQEISRIEQDLEREWKEKLDRLQTQQDRILASKNKEIDQLRALGNENQSKLQEVTEELEESKEQVKAYEERWEKIQERIVLMKERMAEIEEERTETINSEVKKVVSLVYLKLKKRIRPTKQLTGEEFLTRALDIIKKSTLKILSNTDEDQASTDEPQSEEETAVPSNDEPTNGNAIDQTTLTEAVESNDLEEKVSDPQPKNGWDTVDDLPQETEKSNEPLDQSQIVLVQEQNTDESNQDTPHETEEVNSTDVQQEDRHDSHASTDTVTENEPIPPTQIDLSKEEKEEAQSDEDDDNEAFESARPSIQELPPVPPPTVTSPPKFPFRESIPLMSNADDSDEDPFK